MRPSFKIAALATAMLGLSAVPGQSSDLVINALQTEGVHVGNGVICNTQNEVSNFVKTMEKLGPGNAIATVNHESRNPAACGLATIAFEHGRELGSLRTESGSYTIMQIDIIAAATNDGSWHPITRQTQFTAVKLDGLDI